MAAFDAWDEMVVVGKCRKCGRKLWAYPWEEPVESDPKNLECIHCRVGVGSKSDTPADPERTPRAPST